MGFAGWLAGGIISGVWRRCSVRVVLDILEYYLRSILPRALPYLLLMPRVESEGIAANHPARVSPLGWGQAADRHN